MATLVFDIETAARPRAEKCLLLGWNDCGATILRELDNYVPRGSQVLVGQLARGLEARGHTVHLVTHGRLLATRPGPSGEVPAGTDLFFRLDPLVALTTWLAAHEIVRGTALALATVAVTVLLGRVFCGWVIQRCPPHAQWRQPPGRSHAHREAAEGRARQYPAAIVPQAT